MKKLYYKNSLEYHIYGLEYESGQKREYPNNLSDINVVSINGEQYEVGRYLDNVHVQDHNTNYYQKSYQYYIYLNTELEGFSVKTPLSDLIELGYEVYYIS